ncbi:hypothetical protein ACH49_12070 [Streptomyces leeuwenhoekii]|uniref:Uncharacterized protein n=1 Tax=Streptomyces leeuwenhoekii TaxID=1437453 RepID=A0ABR5HZQ9_STRLW|nr:hypothetical protein [Streptomyces leeuwenhoekii]KMS79562.1 hypothetical protein ACH49_12070 [Streptomyces leeuwenhoekii]
MSTQTPAPGSAHHRLLALLDRYADPQGKLDAYLAEKLRTIVDTIEAVNPDRNADFSEGVDWTLDRLRSLIDDLAGGAR